MDDLFHQAAQWQSQLSWIHSIVLLTFHIQVKPNKTHHVITWYCNSFNWFLCFHEAILCHIWGAFWKSRAGSPQGAYMCSYQTYFHFTLKCGTAWHLCFGWGMTSLHFKCNSMSLIRHFNSIMSIPQTKHQLHISWLGRWTRSGFFCSDGTWRDHATRSTWRPHALHQRWI